MAGVAASAGATAGLAPETLSGARRKGLSFIARAGLRARAVVARVQASTDEEGMPMAEAATKPPFPVIREAVASFREKKHVRNAVARLLAAGFKPADISVLASHDSLEVAGGVPGYPGRPLANLFAGLTDEVSLLAPLTVAGFVLVSGGPVAMALAALVGAGLGGAAIKEVLDRYTANQHSAEFAAALQAGAVLLWVRVDDPELEATAVRLLEEAGGRHAHMHARAQNEAEKR
jgi:hypothetical protein